MMKTSGWLVSLLLLNTGMCLSTVVAAQESWRRVGDEPVPLQVLWDEVRGGFSSQLNVQGFGVAQQPADSALNPNNTLEIPRYQVELNLRPNFNLNFRPLELSVKPRLELRWREWKDGVRQGDSDTDTELFVQEWLARYRITDELFVSYGRENLQWGPSFLLSPSNPFNPDNGLNNPRLEVPGLDYGRVVWIPSYTWTVSFIANIDEGRLDLIQDFQKTYAIKLDYTGEEKYVSLIPSYREDGEFRLGFLAGWTVSEALLVYTEGTLSDTIEESEILVGASYTLELGPTIVAEFFHNGDGCTLEPFALCFTPGFGDADPADVLIRKNYLLLQYTHSRIADTTFGLRLRWMRNLDDDSNRIISILDYGIGDHTLVFVIGNVDVGDREAEFGSLLDYSVTAGAKYTF